LGRAIRLGGALPTSLVTSDGGGLNARSAHAAELPGANMIADARSIARLYAATVGEVDGIRLLTPATVAEAAAIQTSRSEPYGLPPGMEAARMDFGLGFMQPPAASPWLGPGSFGHPGAGGSLGFANPEAGVGFGYVMNQMAGGASGDPRTAGLIAAVRECLR
jgi:CubicO group peptidase (beta-lactamase class C family)